MATDTPILSARTYNEFLIDHDAAVQSVAANLKSNHVGKLVNILETHGLGNDLEVHLLHRHFELQEDEAIVHKEIVMETTRCRTSPGHP